MGTLYVATAGARVRKTGHRLVVSTEEGVLQSIRLRDLERVVLAGRVEVTTPALLAMLEAGVETTLLSRGSRLLGTLHPPGSRNVFLRVTQVKRHQDPTFRLQTGRSIVHAKVTNARRVLQQTARRRPDLDLAPALEALKVAARKALEAPAIAQLMGIEGDAASVYFRAYGSLFLRDLRFEKRSRRPPKDPVNSLLSLGYTLLSGEAVGAVASAGLDPDVGMFHELSYGRPSMALDLVEEFRQPVVDRLVLSLCNRRVFSGADFRTVEEGGQYLQDEARKRFFDYYDRTVNSTFQDSRGRKTTFRALLLEQARLLARAIQDGTDYQPFHFH